MINNELLIGIPSTEAKITKETDDKRDFQRIRLKRTFNQRVDWYFEVIFRKSLFWVR